MSNARNLARLLPNSSGQLPDAAMSSGSVIQVVTGYVQGEQSTTSTSFVDSGLSASITPLSTNSKILVIATFSGGVNNLAEAHYTFAKNGVDLVGGNGIGRIWNAAAANYTFAPTSVSYIDSPGSISSITYMLRFKTSNSGTRVYISGGNCRDQITLMEIAA